MHIVQIFHIKQQLHILIILNIKYWVNNNIAININASRAFVISIEMKNEGDLVFHCLDILISLLPLLHIYVYLCETVHLFKLNKLLMKKQYIFITVTYFIFCVILIPLRNLREELF